MIKAIEEIEVGKTRCINANGYWRVQYKPAEPRLFFNKWLWFTHSTYLEYDAAFKVAKLLSISGSFSRTRYLKKIEFDATLNLSEEAE